MKKTFLFSVLSLLISFSVNAQSSPDLTINNPSSGQTYIANIVQYDVSVRGWYSNGELKIWLDHQEVATYYGSDGYTGGDFWGNMNVTPGTHLFEAEATNWWFLGIFPFRTKQTFTFYTRDPNSPELSVSPLDIDLERNYAGSSFDKYFTVENIGTGTLNSTISENASWITGISLTQPSLSAGQSTEIQLTGFFPSGSTDFSTSVSIISNGGSKNIIIHGTLITPLSLYIEGPSYMTYKESPKMFTANVSGGVTPYTYSWYRRSLGSSYWDNIYNTSGSIQQGGGVSSFELKCVVTDASGTIAETTHTVENGNDNPQASKKFVEFPAKDKKSTVSPNPFTYTSTINYTLTENGKVRIALYDLNGREVKLLVDRNQSTGNYQAEWNGEGYNNNRLPTGVYICSIVINGCKETLKIYLK